MRPERERRTNNRTLTINEKVAAVRRVQRGESKASVARDLGIPESTLRGWCKAEARLTRAMQNNNECAGSQSTNSGPSSPDTSSGDGSVEPLNTDEQQAGPSGLQRTSSLLQRPLVAQPTNRKRRRTNETPELDATDAARVQAATSSAVNFDATSLSALVASTGSSALLDYLSAYGLTDEQKAALFQSSASMQLLNMYSQLYQSRTAASNLLGIANGISSAATTSNSSTVNLVEDGLQYVRNTDRNNVNSNGVTSNGNSSSSSTVNLVEDGLQYVRNTERNGISINGSYNGSSSNGNNRRSSSIYQSTGLQASTIADVSFRSSRQSESPAAKPPSPALAASNHTPDYYNSSSSASQGTVRLANGHTNDGLLNDTSIRRESYTDRSSRGFLFTDTMRQAWLRTSEKAEEPDNMESRTSFWRCYQAYGPPMNANRYRNGTTPQLTLQQQLQLRRSPPNGEATVTSTASANSTGTDNNTSINGNDSSTTTNATDSSSTNGTDNTSTTSTSPRAPANLSTRSTNEVKAILDSFLYNNNKDEEKNTSTTEVENQEDKKPIVNGINGNVSSGSENDSDEVASTTLPVNNLSVADALHHGEIFLQWIRDNGNHRITHVDRVQLEGLLGKIREQSLENGIKRTSSKRSRKNDDCER